MAYYRHSKEKINLFDGLSDDELADKYQYYRVKDEASSFCCNKHAVTINVCGNGEHTKNATISKPWHGLG